MYVTPIHAMMGPGRIRGRTPHGYKVQSCRAVGQGLEGDIIIAVRWAASRGHHSSRLLQLHLDLQNMSHL